VQSQGRRRSARHQFATNLRAARLARGLTQERLGELADLHPTYISSVERAERNVSIDTMERLARALDLSLSALLADQFDAAGNT
jgi:transcriptional regulator with XRE-family HTH domain